MDRAARAARTCCDVLGQVTGGRLELHLVVLPRGAPARDRRPAGRRDSPRSCGRSPGTAPSPARAAARRPTSRWPRWTRRPWTGWPATGRGRGGHLPADAHPDRHGRCTAWTRRHTACTSSRSPSCWTGPATPRCWPPPGSTWSTAPRSCAAAVALRDVPGRCRWCTASATLPVTEHDWSTLTAEQRAAELERCSPSSGAGRSTWPAAPLLRVPWSGSGRTRCAWCGPSTTSCWTAGASSTCWRRPGRARRAGPRRAAAPARPPALRRLRRLARRPDTGGARSTGGASWRTSPHRPPLPYDRRPAPTTTARSGTWLSQRLDADATAAPPGVRPPPPAHPQHPGAGRLGAAAGPLERRVAGVLRHHRLRPARRPGRRRHHRRPVHHHPARRGSASTAPPNAAPGCARCSRRKPRTAGSTTYRCPSCAGLSELPPGTPMFDSLVVFENYPVGDATPGRTACGCASWTPGGHQLPAHRGRLARRPTGGGTRLRPAVLRPGDGPGPLSGQLLHTLSALAASDGTARLDDIEVLPVRRARAGCCADRHARRSRRSPGDPARAGRGRGGPRPDRAGARRRGPSC